MYALNYVTGLCISKFLHLSSFLKISNNFIYLSQLDSLKQGSTSNAGIALIHFIYTSWVRNNMMSTLVFDITKFFPSLNHQLLPLIIGKTGFNAKISHFFSNYLVGRKTQYFWNNFSSSFFSVNIGVGQGLALSPILSALYITPILHILEKCLQILKNPVSILSFVNDGLLMAQSKLLTISNSLLFCSYNITSSILERFGLIMEHRKMKVIHFSRLHEVFYPSLLDLSALGGLILHSKSTWKYLGFIFDRKLSFWQHINFYANKAISMVKCIKILGNYARGLNP